MPDREVSSVVGVARGNTVEAREEARSRMVVDAGELGADAVVNVRFETSEIANGGAEVIAYGTAVELDDRG